MGLDLAVVNRICVSAPNRRGTVVPPRGGVLRLGSAGSLARHKAAKAIILVVLRFLASTARHRARPAVQK